MNKYAAEKIASEYYNLGMQLAMRNSGLLKTASPLTLPQIAALLPGGGVGAHLGTGRSGEALLGGLKNVMAGSKADLLGYQAALEDAYRKALSGIYSAAAGNTDVLKAMP